MVDKNSELITIDEFCKGAKKILEKKLGKNFSSSIISRYPTVDDYDVYNSLLQYFVEKKVLTEEDLLIEDI